MSRSHQLIEILIEKLKKKIKGITSEGYIKDKNEYLIDKLIKKNMKLDEFYIEIKKLLKKIENE